jgi:hypothetical protein
MSPRITYITAYYNIPNTGNKFDSNLEKASKLSLKIPHPMIIFCEPETYPRIKAERAKYGYLTHYVVKPLTELELYSYLSQIRDNRKTRPRADSNNTPEYQLISCSKFVMIRDAINKNIFGSEYYAWIDFTMEETEYSNIAAIRAISNDIISNRDNGLCARNNVRMCFISYTAVAEVLDLEKYYNQHGRCGIAGTFYSGSAEKLLKFVNMCIECFKDIVGKGFGHSDEQIYLQVLVGYILGGGKIKDLFEFYFGDYQYVLSNYVEFNSGESKAVIMNVFLPNVINDKANHPECKELVKRAIMYVMDGYKRGKMDMNKDEIVRCFEAIM